ncbi:MAG: hypothetical protein SVU32_05655, partial [Candidatus Nanohaloarchaea archaeon]|nr:hypothetical protein [Candidatus Nanohaloarchaea archaeon]
FQALQQYTQNPTENIGVLMRFFVVPLVVVWTLVYAVLDAGVGRFFDQKILGPLAFIFGLSTLFSSWFITLAAFINVFGSLGLVVFALLQEWRGQAAEVSGESRAARRTAKKDKNLEEQAEKVDKKISNTLRKHQGDIDHPEFIRLAEEAEETPLNKYEALQDIFERIGNISGGLDNKYGKQIKHQVKRKRNLAKQWKKYNEERLKEDLHDPSE